MPLPDAVRSAGLTVFAPLRRHLRTGARVAVIGLGGLGHLAVQFAFKMGEKNSSRKLNYAPFDRRTF